MKAFITHLLFASAALLFIAALASPRRSPSPPKKPQPQQSTWPATPPPRVTKYSTPCEPPKYRDGHALLGMVQTAQAAGAIIPRDACRVSSTSLTNTLLIPIYEGDQQAALIQRLQQLE